MLAALSAGRTLVLAPRLDGPSLAGQLVRERPAVVLAGQDAPADLVPPPGVRLQRL